MTEWTDRSKAITAKANKLKGRYESARDRLHAVRKSILLSQEEAETLEQVKILIQQVAQMTQSKIEVHLSELVTVALRAIFPDPYTMKITFVQRRGRTEVDLNLQREGNEEIDPMSSVGGGVIDVISFALRICFWSLSRGQISNTMIMDEPFRYFNDPSRQMQEKAGVLLHTLSKKLECQFIVVSMIDELAKHADRVFEVSQAKGISRVKEIPCVRDDGKKLEELPFS